MNPLESVPAVRRIETGRRDLQAFDIVGRISSADIENLYGLLEAAYALAPRLNVLLRIIDNDGVTWTEVAPETISEGKRHAANHVQRCAIVADSQGLTAARGFFLDTKPVELRQFAPNDEETAWAWVGEPPA